MSGRFIKEDDRVFVFNTDDDSLGYNYLYQAEVPDHPELLNFMDIKLGQRKFHTINDLYTMCIENNYDSEGDNIIFDVPLTTTVDELVEEIIPAKIREKYPFTNDGNDYTIQITRKNDFEHIDYIKSLYHEKIAWFKYNGTNIGERTIWKHFSFNLENIDFGFKLIPIV